MKKKYIIIGLILVVLLGIVLFYERPVEDELPLLVRVDGILYRLYDDVQEQPKEDADGYIVGIVSGIIPTDNQTANFGDVGMRYWKSDNEIYIQTNGEHLIFVPTED